MTETIEEWKSRMHERRTANLIPSRLAKCGLSKKDIRLIVSGEIEETKAVKAVKAFLEEDPSSQNILILSGGTGCGKTSAAAWAISAAFSDDDSLSTTIRPEDIGLFLDVSSFVLASRYEKSDMAKLMKVKLLAIDDLGNEFMDDRGSFTATFDAVINARYANELKTILTTNVPSKYFMDRYGQRIVDRIRESGTFFEISGKSMRNWD